jgi:glutamate-1-semialdehyde aminotransferase
VYWPASNYEAAFFSYAHTQQDIDAIIGAAAAAFKDVAVPA